MGKTITAVNIKKLWYGDTSKITAKLTGVLLFNLLKTATEVKNVHGETWTLEEAEANKTVYKNQLTGKVYRSDKEMGEVKMNFTIGEYDYATKADLLGGTATDTTWERAKGKVSIEKFLVGLTEDDQYIVIPRADIAAREATTDKAVGLPIVGTEIEPTNEQVAAEYWFDASVVKSA
jgi:hypothetical protein|nr:MAG TPA: hypothetical protein [Caudoviricetes sp.]DAX75425.1 MAG TPA: hypothetical protein [Caudoviricetes sp.]